jgi:ABC-type transport system substrate-binding protein
MENQIGTGSFELKKFVRDDRFVLEGVADHWRKVPDIKKLTQVNVPDETVRLAMLESGQGDIVQLGAENKGAALRGGFTTASSGSGGMFAVWFPGNLWEDVHAKTGEALERNTYVHDIPWVGNPLKPADPDNPAGLTDMDQARMVREALAWSVDRELLVEIILLGDGSVQHSVHYDSRDALWSPSWEFGYDTAKAEALLDAAGFPRKSDGWRFKMPMYGWSSSVMTDAVAGMFREVGVEAEVLHFQYSVWRPSVVTRSATMPWMDGWSANRPYDEPIAAQCSSVTRGGKSRGAEAAACTKAYLEIGSELDYDKRIALAQEFAEWNRKWVLQFGVASENKSLVVNPEYIASWDMFPGRRYVVNSWEEIVLK